MALPNDNILALANRFTVTVDIPKTMDLGSWAKVDGLDVTFDIVEYRSGDMGNDRWYTPGFSKYSMIKLSRAVSSDTSKTREWLSLTGKTPTPGGMVIALFDSAATKVFEWEMRSAIPAKWSITGFDAGTSKLATEQLDIVHMGFLDDEAAILA